jgi:hypothetical protein
MHYENCRRKSCHRNKVANMFFHTHPIHTNMALHRIAISNWKITQTKKAKNPKPKDGMGTLLNQPSS